MSFDVVTTMNTIYFWNDTLYLTKDMYASFFNVDVHTTERYISKYDGELIQNGYSVLKGTKLQDFLKAYEGYFATDINVGHKIRALSVFDFPAFLNMAMFLVESETAAELQRIILDIVIDIVNQKAGGETKYINQCGQEFIGAFLQERTKMASRDMALRMLFIISLRNDWYPTFVDKLTHLFFCTCQFHCFSDGNKRLAITLSTLFLLQKENMRTILILVSKAVHCRIMLIFLLKGVRNNGFICAYKDANNIDIPKFCIVFISYYS